jgi:hypothetical protein
MALRPTAVFNGVSLGLVFVGRTSRSAADLLVSPRKAPAAHK